MIKEDEQIAQKFGSNGTPAFYVNGRHLSGAQPFEAFQKLIDEEKAKAEKFLAEKKPAKDKLYEEMIKGFETELKVATVIAAEPVPKSNKLLKLAVDLGGERRQLVAGIAKEYAPEALVGRRVVVVANLQPATLMGVESQGMVLAASVDGAPVLLRPDREVPAGSRVK